MKTRSTINQILADKIEKASKNDRSRISRFMQQTMRRKRLLAKEPYHWLYVILLHDMQAHLKILVFDDMSVITYLENYLRRTLNDRILVIKH